MTLLACLLKPPHNVPLHAYESTGCTGASAVPPTPLVTMQHQSIVLWQSLFQGHIITVLDTAQGYFSQHWTNRYSLRFAINLYGCVRKKREGEMFFCVSLHHPSHQVTRTWAFRLLDVAISIWLPAHRQERASRSKCQLMQRRRKKSVKTVWNMEWVCRCGVIKLGCV